MSRFWGTRWVLLCLLAALAVTQGRAETPSTQASLFVRQLGAGDYRTRRAAETALRGLRRSDVLPALLLAFGTETNAETRKAVIRLLSNVAWPTDKEQSKTQLARLDALVKNREIDRAIEALVYWRDYHGKEARKHSVELTRALLGFAEAESGLTAKQIEFKPVSETDLFKPEIRTQRGEHTGLTVGYFDNLASANIIRGIAVAGSMPYTENYGPTEGVLLLNDASEGNRHFTMSRGLFFLNGDFKCHHACCATSSIIICNGNIEVPGHGKGLHLNKSIIIADWRGQTGQHGI